MKNPLLNSLDEFGIPPIIGKRVVSYLREIKDIDIALEKLRGASISKDNNSEFEYEILSDSIKSM